MKRRTYAHLEALGKKPSEYEIATSRLLYYVERGLEVETPAGDWLRRYQQGSPLRAADWERFEDPRATTYSKYVELQKKKELYVDGLLDAAEQSGYDRALAPDWLGWLSRTLGPLRYAASGLQMLAAYVGHMAPGGRIAITCLLQTGDELRRIQRLAYRTRQLQDTRPTFGKDSRQLWQTDPAWQPLRELIERLLVTYDWGEALIGLNLALKPRFDQLFMIELGALARVAGDDLLERVLGSLDEDCRWHRAWTRDLLGLALELRESRQAVEAWLAHWTPFVDRALSAFDPLFAEGRRAAGGPEADPPSRRLAAFDLEFRTQLGLGEGSVQHAERMA